MDYLNLLVYLVFGIILYIVFGTKIIESLAEGVTSKVEFLVNDTINSMREISNKLNNSIYMIEDFMETQKNQPNQPFMSPSQFETFKESGIFINKEPNDFLDNKTNLVIDKS